MISKGSCGTSRNGVGMVKMIMIHPQSAAKLLSPTGRETHVSVSLSEMIMDMEKVQRLEGSRSERADHS